MEIQHFEKNNKGLFFVRENGKRVAEMTYKRKNKNTIVIDHTEVEKSLQGKGVGLELVLKAVEYAREDNQKIIPECSYAKSVLDKREDLADVLFS
jgi:predicted GNAT family acetyltransferase